MQNFIRVGLFLFVFNSILNSAEIDTIPRSRLISDAEFIALFPEELFRRQNISHPVSGDDTVRTLRQIAAYFQERQTPVYFWGVDNINQRIDRMKKTYPDQVDKIVNNANFYISTYGANVDWKMPGKDLLGRPHTPNTIRFLARQAYAPDIALSYLIMGDKKYVQFLKDQIRDFVTDYENGRTESGKNDVFERFYGGHRLRNWLFMYHVVRNTPEFAWQDHIFMLKTFLLHGARLIDVCNKFNWGNHQLHGLAAMYEMTAMFPELPVMSYWFEQSRQVTLEHLEKEIHPDGFQFERASHYFKFDIINYFRVYQLSKLNRISLPEIYEQRFPAMFDAIIKLSKPDRQLPVLQDAQNIYEKRSNDAAELSDPTDAEVMSLGALLYHSAEFKYFAEQDFPAVFDLFFTQSELDTYSSVLTQPPHIGSVALDSSRYYVMRSGWEKDDLYLLIDGGLAKYKPDHSHGGILGIIMHAFGEELLPNYRVRYSDPSYRTMKNSLVKNVALADHLLQGQNWISNTSRTGFGIWGNLPQPHVAAWFAGKYFDYFSGTHNAFEELGVNYARSVLFFKPDCWLVIDEFKSERFHDYQQIWQGDFGIDDQYNALVLKKNNARLFILQADPSEMEIRRRKIFQTVSVEFDKQAQREYTFFTLIYPENLQNDVLPEIRLFERSPYQQVQVFAGTSEYTYYRKKQKFLELDELYSNGDYVACVIHSDSLNRVLMYNGSELVMGSIDLKCMEKCTIELNFTDSIWHLNYIAGPRQKIRLNNREYQIKTESEN